MSLLQWAALSNVVTHLQIAAPFGTYDFAAKFRVFVNIRSLSRTRRVHWTPPDSSTACCAVSLYQYFVFGTTSVAYKKILFRNDFMFQIYYATICCYSFNRCYAAAYKILLGTDVAYLICFVPSRGVSSYSLDRSRRGHRGDMPNLETPAVTEWQAFHATKLLCSRTR
jgi:hypothetical protein